MGWGAIPDDHPLMAGMVGLQTSTATATRRCWQSTSSSASATAGPTATPARPRSTPRAASSCMSTSSRPRSAASSRPISASSPTPRRRCSFRRGGAELKAAGRLQDGRLGRRCRSASSTMLRKTDFDNVPMKPQRVYQEMNKAFGPRHLLRQHDRAVADRRRPVPARVQAAPLDHLRARPGRWAGRCRPPSASRRRSRRRSWRYPATTFQFLIEELAVGAQFKLPYSTCGEQRLSRPDPPGGARLRHGLRGQLGFENINAPEVDGYGVDHVKAAEAFGCMAIRVTEPEGTARRCAARKQLMEEHRLPVVVEVILERVTNIAMGTEIDKITEFEEISTCRRKWIWHRTGVANAGCRPSMEERTSQPYREECNMNDRLHRPRHHGYAHGGPSAEGRPPLFVHDSQPVPGSLTRARRRLRERGRRWPTRRTSSSSWCPTRPMSKRCCSATAASRRAWRRARSWST